jgi:hypothetical protein
MFTVGAERDPKLGQEKADIFPGSGSLHDPSNLAGVAFGVSHIAEEAKIPRPIACLKWMTLTFREMASGRGSGT